MSRFTFVVEIEVVTDMQGETGEDWAKNLLEGDLGPLPYSWRIVECKDEEAE